LNYQPNERFQVIFNIALYRHRTQVRNIVKHNSTMGGASGVAGRGQLTTVPSILLRFPRLPPRYQDDDHVCHLTALYYCEANRIFVKNF